MASIQTSPIRFKRKYTTSYSPKHSYKFFHEENKISEHPSKSETLPSIKRITRSRRLRRSHRSGRENSVVPAPTENQEKRPCRAIADSFTFPVEFRPTSAEQRERGRETEEEGERKGKARGGGSVREKGEESVRTRGSKRGAGSFLASRGHYRTLLTGEQRVLADARLSGLTDVRSFGAS